MLTYGDLRTWAAEQFKEDVTDTVFTTTLFLRWVNQALDQIASAADWTWLEGMGEFQLGADGAGTSTNLGVTYFPHHIHRLVTVWPIGRGYREPLMIIGAWELDNLSPSATAGTVSDYLAIWGYYNVGRDNPTAGQIVGTATAGAPGNGAQFRIEGIDANGLEVQEDVTLAGAGVGTSVNNYAAGPDGVRRIYVIDASIAGAVLPVVITFTSGGVQIETINVALGERIHEHLRTEVSPAPAAGTGGTHIVRYYKRIRPVRSVNDIMDLPFEFEDLLMIGMGRQLAEFRQDTELAMYYQQQFTARTRDLKKWQNRKPGRMRGIRRLSSYGYRTYQGISF